MSLHTCDFLLTVTGVLSLTHSEELAQYLNSEVVPALNQIKKDCTDADVAASEIGEYKGEPVTVVVDERI